MTNQSTFISLGMPVYNGENYIREAIDSILGQTFTNFELIITDNSSSDSTAAIVDQFVKSDPRVRYFLNDGNIGAAGNYNRCYELGRGKYHKWCAHDDILSPNYIEECIGILEANPDLSLAFGATKGINKNGKIVSVTGQETSSVLFEDPSSRFFEQVVNAGTCFPIFGVFRRSMLDKSTMHRPYYGSDRALLAEMVTLGGFERVESAVFYCREHEERSIRIDDKLARSKWQGGKANRLVAAEHINLLRHLFEITGRHKNIVSPWRMRRRLMGFALRPLQLGRYAIEVVSIISPKTSYFLKSVFKR